MGHVADTAVEAIVEVMVMKEAAEVAEAMVGVAEAAAAMEGAAVAAVEMVVMSVREVALAEHGTVPVVAPLEGAQPEGGVLWVAHMAEVETGAAGLEAAAMAEGGLARGGAGAGVTEVAG